MHIIYAEFQGINSINQTRYVTRGKDIKTLQ